MSSLFLRSGVRVFGLAGLLLISAEVQGDGPAASPELEKELLAVLQGDAPSADKAITCKKLAIYGSGAAVPDVAKLLPDPQLSSWARIALEAIPGPEADEALKTAMGSLEGNLLIGVINSLGVRRSEAATAALVARLKDANPEVGSAAAVALGHIASAEATQALTAALTDSAPGVRSAIAEGCVLCAERLLRDGKAAEAVAIYDSVRKSEVPVQRVIESTRGAILARGAEGLPLLLEQLRSPEVAFFRLGLGAAREFSGSEIDQALVAEVAAAEPDRAALIIQAMADRPATVVLAAVLKAAEQGPRPVRLSAIHALARVGNDGCLTSLLKIAVEPDEELAGMAQATLAVLPGETVDSQIVTLLPKSQGPTYPVLIELVGKRRIEAIALLKKALDNADAKVRQKALVALGETVSLNDLTILVSQVLAPKRPEDLATAEVSLKAASIRMADREACAAKLASAVETARTIATKTTLLQILGSMGGPTALQAVGKAARSTDPQLADVSSRLLGEWMTEDAAPVLLDLSKISSNPYQIRALRGYIRIARQFVLPDEQRTEMCQKAFDTARQAAEKKLVLDILKRYPTVDNMKLAIRAKQNPDLKEDATQAILVIAQKLSGKEVDIKELLISAGIEKMKVEVVKAEYGSGPNQKDVTEILKKQISDLPLITLPNASYNNAFGGDPAPGQVKQLKVKYTLNGKTGDATFPEDSLIVLPVPK